ncbi:MAG: putative phosphosugar isomerase [Phycisphaerae bacterium]
MNAERDETLFAQSILRAEASAIAHLADRLDADFSRAVDLIDACSRSGGTVLVTGLGKSGLIGAKIAATLASLGIPAHSVHPSEAAHGDLGRFRPSDTVIAISFSGETEEVVNLAAVLRQDGLPIISITGRAASQDRSRPPSSLERLATVALRLGVEAEAFGVAPTTSTTATAALGDALALAAARRQNHTDNDFARRHPGGSLGGLLRPVKEVLRFVAGKNLPLAPQSASVRGALEAAATVARRPGALLVVDATGRLAGIFTDGDLRRLVLTNPAALDQPIERVMTRTPRTLPASAMVRDAVHMIQEHRQDEIPVIDDDGKPVGILDVQDLIAMRLVRSE